MKEFVALIIGDEIISGKRADSHFAAIAGMLQKRGLRLKRVEYLGDNRAQLASVLKRTKAAGEVVFSFGGIGNTPDDHTRQAAAEAFDSPLKINAEGLKMMALRYKETDPKTDAARAQLVAFPEKAELIPNPFNNVPGFFLHEHYFVPGFPQMAHPMIVWVLENFYKAEFKAAENVIDKALLLTGREAYESALLPLMEVIQQKYPTCRLYSLPFVRPDKPYHLELGIEGEPELVDSAFAEILENFQNRPINYRWREN